MSRRNFILLIIILIFIVAGVLGFFYFQSKYLTEENTNTPGINFLAQFNPFRSNPAVPAPEVPTSTPTEVPPIVLPGEEPMVKLRKISSMPVAGFTLFSKERLKEVPVVPKEVEVATTVEVKKKKTSAKPTPPPTEFSVAIRYVERATGNIYQTFIDKIEERKFSETIIPKIYDAYFGNRGQSIIMRHLKLNDKTIETFSGILPKEKLGEDIAMSGIKGSFLTDNIKDINLSPDTSKIFYLSNVGESIVGTILNILDGKKNQIFNSSFTEWNSLWPNSKTITLTTKPSGNVPGYMYAINVDKKDFNKILGDINGLTTLMSPNSKLVLVGNGNLSLYVYNIDKKIYTLLGIKTLPEKCVWNKTSESVYCAVPKFIDQALYPDDWYRGEVSFSDQIWKINTKDGNTTLVIDPINEIGGEEIDIIKLGLDDNENYLFFVNKKDSFLWKLEFK